MFFLDKKWFGQIVAFLCLFGGPGVMLILHYPIGVPGSSSIFVFHPAAYFLIILTVYNLILHQFHWGEIKEYYNYILCVFIVLFYSLTFGASKGNMYLFNVLFCPALIIYNFQFINVKRCQQVMSLIKIFFYADCILAILENIFRFKLFPINETLILFRSNALQGHPLNNSLFLLFFSLFFYSYEKNFFIRMIIIGLTVGALASFGVRSGLVAYSLGITLLSLKFIEKGKINFSLKNIAILLILVVSVVYIVFYTTLGTRITTAGSFNDNSSDVRFGVYSLFMSISISDIIWGVPQQVIDYLMYIRGIEIIENFWIIWIFKYGVIFTIYLGTSFILFLFKLTKLAFPVKRYDQLVVLGCFILAASSNNSFATNTMVINAVTILCLAKHHIYKYDVYIQRKKNINIPRHLAAKV